MFFRGLALVLVVFGIAVWPSASSAQTAATIAIEPFFGGSFKAGQWLPVRVVVTNEGADRRAIVRLNGEGGSTFDTAVELPRGARKALVMYMRPENFARTIRARLIEDEQELAAASAAVSAWSSRGVVIGQIMARPLAAPQPESASTQIPLYLAGLTLADLPARPEALRSFDILLLDGVPLTELQPEQASALSDWIRAGGQLVVGTAEGDQVLETLPEPLRIASRRPAGQPLAETILRELGADTEMVTAALTPVEGASALDPLIVQKEIGRGRVTVLGFSLGDPALQRLPRENALWSSAVTIKPFDPNFPPDMSPEEMQAQQLTQALFNLPALALPPLTMLAALLIAYIVLVGPVLYLLLWRLDRQAWAWVAIPALTVLFSAGAYSYGLSIRGEDVILNQISIVQPAGERASVRSYAGIFSPTARSYDVSVAGEALTRPVAFDARMMGRPTTQGTSAGHYLQGSSGVRNLEVGQWTMSTFAAEATLPFGSITAEIELGDGVLKGTVRNDGGTTVRDGALVYGGRAEVIGDIAPGEAKPVELRVGDSINQGGQPLSMTLFKDRWNPQGPPPNDLRLPIQVIDSLYSYTPWATTTRPFVLGWLDQSPIAMQVDEGRVQYQQLTLLEVPVDLRYGQTVTFPRGWTRAEYQGTRPEEGSCMTQWGPGAVLMSSEVLTATIKLPADARQINVDKATIFTQVEGPPSDRVVIEVYDWAAEQWTAQAERLGTIDLSDPARFVRNQELRVRLNLGPAVMRGGCLHVAASIGGTR